MATQIILSTTIFESTDSETIQIPDVGAETVQSVILQVERDADWTGSVTLWAKLKGSDMLARPIPFQNLRTASDVDANTALTEADLPDREDADPTETGGLYAVRLDGLELEVRHAYTSGGALRVAFRTLVG